MIELLIAACLANGECREVPLLYDARDVSLMTCMIAGQREVAVWQERNPDWTVARWTCGFYGDRAEAA